VVGAAPIRSNEELWERVAMVREGLRAAGTTAETQRLHNAIELLRERPALSRGVTPD
jgi:hypothetical protein